MKTAYNKTIKNTIPEILPVIPTMDVVVFPHMIVPLLVLDESIIKGINKAIDESKLFYAFASKKQLDNYEGAIGTQDLLSIGTVASIMRLVKIPEGGVKILVQGICKAELLKKLWLNESMLNAQVEIIEYTDQQEDTEVNAQIKNIKEMAEQMASAGQSFSPDFHIILIQNARS